MRRARQYLILALALPVMLLAGNDQAHAGARIGVRASVVFPVRPAFYYWDPYWYPYPGLGYGFSCQYAPNPYQAYPRNLAPVELHVSPRKSDVIVDGANVGQARDFNSAAYPLWLKAGTHTLELHRDGYQTLRVKFVVQKGRAYRVHYELREGEGIDSRSSNRAPQPPPPANPKQD